MPQIKLPKQSEILISDKPVKMVDYHLKKSTSIPNNDNSLILKEINNEISHTIIGNTGSNTHLNTDFLKSNTNTVTNIQAEDMPIRKKQSNDFVKKYKSFASDQIKRWEDVINNIKEFQDLQDKNEKEVKVGEPGKEKQLQFMLYN